MRERRGFSLVELIMAISLTLVVFAITLPFVKVQTRALGENAGRLDAEQIARYAQRAIDQELRLAANDPGQPMLVYAGKMSIAFNVNLLAPDTTDPNALYVETGAASTLTEAWRVANAATIPLSSRTYPTADYTDASGALSRIETIQYFLRADTITGRSDIYVLYRRVNARDSVQIVRGINVPTDSSFFSYQRMVSGSLTTIAASLLPLPWDSTMTSEIRAVGLRSAGFFRNRQTGEDVIRTIYWTVVLNNRTTPGRDCGAAPGQPPNNKVSYSVPGGSNAKPYRVEFTWDASPDDAGGATDVSYYLIERKRAAASSWTTIATQPATRSASYQWSHVFPLDTGSYNYGVRAVDCGGLASARALKNSGSVSLP